MLALVDGQPQVMNLKEVLTHYLEHQKVVIRRRTQFELDKAEARAHILEGLRVALDHLDEAMPSFAPRARRKRRKPGNPIQPL